jgi:NADP-dependent aldehyde dehydrogenase
VRHPDVAAVAFTGSQRGGMALWRLAGERDVVVPVYAEMGTVNPVVVTPAAADRLDDIATGFVESFTLGAGQFCTKPGLLLGPAGTVDAVAAALRAAAPAPVLLTADIAASAAAGVRRLQDAGATLVARTGGDGPGWTAPAAVLQAPLPALAPGSALLQECFGPVALVAEYDDVCSALRAVDGLQGALAGGVFVGEPDPDAARVLARLQRKVGRVIVDGWPTGVVVAWAQHHGGPWPATSNAQATSVGAAALARFVRPVAYQGLPDALLPPPLAPDNPWRLPRRVDGVLVLP